MRSGGSAGRQTMLAGTVRRTQRRTKPAVALTLHMPQNDYLEYIAMRDETCLSQAFAAIVADYIGVSTIAHSPARKARRQIVMQVRHIEVLDRLTENWGVTRSEVARRLIDLARVADPMLRLAC